MVITCDVFRVCSYLSYLFSTGLIFQTWRSTVLVSFTVLSLQKKFFSWSGQRTAHDRAMRSAPDPLKTFDAVVEALGGLREVGRLTRQDTAAVCNWRRRRKRFPTKYYFLMQAELKKRGARRAKRALWGFVER
jgi:hypothetical protein